MNGSFYMACIAMLTGEHFTRTLVAAGVSQRQADVLIGPALWGPDQRVSMRQTLDAVLYSAVDAAALPRFDIPAELAAAVVATVVDPCNWMIAAAWQTGHVPARDLALPEQNIEIVRVTAGAFLSMVFAARAAIEDDGHYAKVAEQVRAKFAVKEFTNGAR